MIEGTRTEQAPVCLVFPPLVTSSFGGYYPATAVLDAYLDAIDIAAWQENLNQQFAEFLLATDNLSLMGSGCVPGIAADSLSAAACRWAARQQEGVLLDPESGRLQKKAYMNHGDLLKAITEPFLVDPGSSILEKNNEPLPWQDLYERFFKNSTIVDRTGHAALVGISVPMGIQLVPALLLAKVLKGAHPSLRLVLGGPSISLMEPRLLGALLDLYPDVDACVRFDGEYPLADLAGQAIAGEWHPETVPGVSCLSPHGVQHIPPGPGPSLHKLPAPRYSPVLLDRLLNPLLGITQARGCYWGKCDYCDFIELFEGSPPFRGRHPDEFVDEIEELSVKYDAKRFTFITESLPPAFARKMSTLMIERGLKVKWLSFAMVDRRFDRELLELMVKAGCDHLVIGMETTITRVLKLVHKSADREENFRFLRDAKAAGMKLGVNLIPDLPSTTYQEAMQALADLHELADCFEYVSVFPFEPTRSSNVGRNPETFGFVPLAGAPVSGIAQYELNHLQSVDPAMTSKERAAVYSQYEKFRRHVNSRRGKSAQVREQTAATLADEAVRLRFAVEDLDVLDVDNGTICYNIRNHRRVSLPTSAELTELLDGRQFRRSEFPSHSDATHAHLPELIRQGFLVRAG